MNNYNFIFFDYTTFTKKEKIIFWIITLLDLLVCIGGLLCTK